MDPVGLATTLYTVINTILVKCESANGASSALAELLQRARDLHAIIQRVTTWKPRMTESQWNSLTAEIRLDECEQTVSQLRSLVSQIHPEPAKKLDIVGKIYFLLKESNVQKLMDEMVYHRKKITDACQPLVVELMFDQKKTSLENAKQFHDMIQSMMANNKSAVLMKSHIDVPRGFASHGPDVSRMKSHMWFGQIRYAPHQNEASSPFFRRLNKLHDSKFLGNWDGVIKLLDKELQEHGQNWTNSVRITASDKTSSGYTALHQAAWHGAPVSVVQQLITRGASRLIPTLKDGEEQTALDIARKFNWSHLYDILSPIIKHTVPFTTLNSLEQHLHVLIQRIFLNEYNKTCYRMPNLAILTELARPLIWFPIHPEDPANPSGVRFCLDGREVVAEFVKSHNESLIYRITRSGYKEIEEAVLLNQ